MTIKVAIFRLSAAAIMLLVYLTISSQAAYTKPPEKSPPALFSTGNSGTINSFSQNGEIRRARNVEVDLSLLGRKDGRGIQKGDKLGLNLFPDTSLTAVPDKVISVASGKLMWHGYIEGEGSTEGEVTLVVNEEVMVGTIRHASRLYKVGYGGSGEHLIQEVNPNEPLPEIPPISVDHLPSGVQAQVSPQGVDDGSVIDIMILYTPAARKAQGGRRAMEALIELAVEEANQAFINSEVDSRLRLVYTAEVSYVESGSLALDLGRLRIAGDGHMDEAPSARNMYGADLVNLVVERGNGCGIAYVMSRKSAGFEAYAFSIVQRQCATGYYSLTHEIGHNMGSEHNRDSQPPPGYGVELYSYGYRSETQTFRTVMSYDCPDGCPRIPYFSNPQVNYKGRATGIDYSTNPVRSADNARSLNGTISIVANWRLSRESLEPPEAPANLGATGISPFSVDLKWQKPGDDATGFVIERSTNGESWQTINQVDAAESNYVDQAVMPESQYAYRVYAFNNGGESPYSNEALAITSKAAKIYFPAVRK